jgi:acetyltransferase
MGLASTSEATQILHRRHTPNFAFPERIASTLAAMWKRKQWLDSHGDDRVTEQAVSHNHPSAQKAIQQGLDEGTEWLSVDLVEKLMNAYQIPIPHSELAASVDEAENVAASIGYPIALKLAATGLTHKTDIGGVILDVETPEALQEGFQTLTERFEQRRSESSVMEGVTIQQMIQDGIEAIVGVVRDPQFGPLLMVGSGGTLVELVRDTTFEICPLTRQQAHEMIDRTQLKRLLAGFRGQSAADQDALVDIMLKLAQMAMDWLEIAEMEINPVMVLAEGAYAVDVRIRLEPVE